MTTDVGPFDRAPRALLGVVLLGAAFFGGMPDPEPVLVGYLAAAIGVVMLVVVAIRVCPVYSVLYFKICRT